MSVSLLQIPHRAQERGNKAAPRELVLVKYILPTPCFRQHKHLLFKTTLQWVISPGWVCSWQGLSSCHFSHSQPKGNFSQLEKEKK